ncbi:SUMO-activating enzyme subunit 1 [Mortierella sp. AD010]|nr:SUMO-activating enzyme subunit 1 [Mortierella sp. AD010]
MEHKITEDEAALYDRQIRLWGLEAQHRMRNASILIAGMRALSNEVCKNIILAGVGSITLLEHEDVTEEDLGAQFLLRQEDVGRNRAEAAAEKARLLNPRVKVVVDTEDIAQKPDSFFTGFNIVCLTGCNPEQMIRIDNTCREGNTGLYAAGVHGFFGYIFCDLKHHEYREESQSQATERGKEPETTVTHKSQSYDSLSSTLECFWGFPKPRALRRKVSPLFFAIQVLWLFQQAHGGRLPQGGDQQDLEAMFKLRDERLKSAQVDNSFVEDELLQTFVETASAEISPVCAIVGGFLAQDILKALSGKDSPLLNYFLYNGIEGTGLVHHTLRPARVPMLRALEKEKKAFENDEALKEDEYKEEVPVQGDLTCESAAAPAAIESLGCLLATLAVLQLEIV